jgi:hypothetical protein
MITPEDQRILRTLPAGWRVATLEFGRGDIAVSIQPGQEHPFRVVDVMAFKRLSTHASLKEALDAGEKESNRRKQPP